MAKNIIVTGASKGLGKHIARSLWQQGANLLLVARNEDKLKALQTELIDHSVIAHQQVVVMAIDLASPEAAKWILQQATSIWSTLYGLINNAAIQGPIGTLWNNDWNDWQTTLQVNLITPIDLCRQCIPWMLKTGGGKIINLSGGGATGPRANFTAYATAKAGLVRFSETLAEETKQLGIDVNCVAPGAMNTELLAEVIKTGASNAGQKEYEFALKVQESTHTTFERVTNLVIFLASSASDGITGKLISAVWDPWEKLPEYLEDLQHTDIYTLRRIVPIDRGKNWG